MREGYGKRLFSAKNRGEIGFLSGWSACVEGESGRTWLQGTGDDAAGVGRAEPSLTAVEHARERHLPIQGMNVDEVLLRSALGDGQKLHGGQIRTRLGMDHDAALPSQSLRSAVASQAFTLSAGKPITFSQKRS